MNAAQRLEKVMEAAENAASALIRHARKFSDDDEADFRISALLQKARAYANAMRRVSRASRRRL
jgi:uncharacterized protein (DUF1778 family)